jgi:hypothetical protein
MVLLNPQALMLMMESPEGECEAPGASE